MAFPGDPEDIEVGFAFGSSAADDPTGLAYEAVTPDSPMDVVTITRGRVADSATTEPTRIDLRLDDPDGEFSPRNITGSRYATLRQGTPMQVRVDVGSGMVTRGRAYVPDWNPRWTGPDIGDHVPISALGMLGRLGRDKVVMSAMRRTILDAEPENYWPLEDGSDATTAGSAIMDAPAMQALGTVTFGAESDLVGSLPTPEMTEGELIGDCLDVGDASWYAEIHVKTAFQGGAIARLVIAAGSIDVIRFLPPSAAGDAVEVIVESAAGAALATLTGVAVSADWENVWHNISITAEQNGANVDFELFVDGESEDTASAALTLGAPLKMWPNHDYNNFAGTSFAHLIVGSTTGRTNAYAAMNGWAGEVAADRVTRLCAEEGVPVDVTAGDTEAMGPQPAAGLLALLRECEAADGGVLLERLDGRLGYDPLVSRYNVAVTMTVDCEALEVTGLDPFDDDRDLYNIITAERQGGGGAVDELADGPVGSDVETGVGPRPLPVVRNLASDLQLPDHASWLLRRGTLNKPRFVLVLDLVANPQLIDDWLACDIGSRVQITGAPEKHVGPDTLDLVIEGYIETIDATVWTVAIFLEPYDLYSVGEYQSASPSDDEPSRYGTNGSQLFAAVDGDDLSFVVLPGDRRWTVAAAAFAPDLRLRFYDAGMPDEVFDVSAIATGTSFVGAGTPAHGNNASVAPTRHASTAIGDTLYLVAAIRNSGTGTVNDVTGYDEVGVMGNLRVFSRTATLTAADNPTVAFTGGVANATTSAVILTFRNVAADAFDTPTSQLNGSAGNIAYPGKTVDMDCALVLGVAWKQDDYTSVAPPFGSEGVEASSTTGDDQSLYVWYQIQTDRTQVQAGTITVTGGASAISRAILMTFAGTQIMTVAARSVNGVDKEHAAGTEIRINKEAVYAK